jgi:hypothetical protein
VQYRSCATRFGAGDFDLNIAITLVVLGRAGEAEPILERLASARPQDPIVHKYLQLALQPRPP